MLLLLLCCCCAISGSREVLVIRGNFVKRFFDSSLGDVAVNESSVVCGYRFERGDFRCE